MKRIGVMTSGGDSPGMNAAIRAVVRACSFYHVECVGFYRGFQGMIEGDYVNLDARSVRNIINRGGTMLKSARSKEFKSEEGRKKAAESLKKANIDGMILIGGDGTFRGAQIFSKEHHIPIIGVPGTIDNDIFGTNYTIGFDTALNTVVEAVDKIRDTASSHDRLFFVEVMGRDAGFIALNSGIGAGAEEIIIPGEHKGMEKLINSLEQSRRSGKNSSIVIVGEGDKIGKNVFEMADYVKENLPYYDAKVTVLGHIQRGGSPTCQDRVLASRLCVKAVELLLDGKKDCMVGLINNKISICSFEEALKDKPKIDKDLLRIANILST